jgi:prevent-host-death family protein
VEAGADSTAPRPNSAVGDFWGASGYVPARTNRGATVRWHLRQAGPPTPKSDNHDFITEISATYAARNSAELLDAVEHKGERITIVRRGRAVAQIEPVAKGLGLDVKSALKRHPVDTQWLESLREIREVVVAEERF